MRFRRTNVNQKANIFVQVDKTVVRITGLSVRGLNVQQLENLLQKKLKTMTRIIGVTGDSLEMDVYGVEEDDILRDADGMICTIALAEGIQVSDVTHLSQVKKICRVDYDHIPPYTPNQCQGERWLKVETL